MTFLHRRSLLSILAGLTLGVSGPVLAQSGNNKPAVFLIGDSTMRNGSRDNGESAGQFGWGHMLHYYFDTSRIDVINDAMGGTSSRSFQDTPTLWPNVLRMIRPGDYVLMAFGHNDSRASLRGNDDATGPAPAPPTRNATGATPGQPGTALTPEQPAMIHSFGWYMRQYIEQVKARGATPIVLSLIPRNRWTGDKVNRNDEDYALWAKQAAEQEHAQFIPLNAMIADTYDQIGQTKVTAELFPPNETVHTNWAGAVLNAQTVVEGLQVLSTPLKNYLLADPSPPATPDVIPPAVGEMGPKALAPLSRTPDPVADKPS